MGGTRRVIVVLGAPVRPDGGPSAALTRRVRVGVRVLQSGQGDRLLLTGGRTVPGRPAEAEVARDLAVAEGAPAGAVLTETESRDTAGNLRAAARLQPGAPLILVSDGWHLPRALWLSGRMGLEASGVSSGAGPVHRWPAVLLREGGAWAKALVLTRR